MKSKILLFLLGLSLLNCNKNPKPENASIMGDSAQDTALAIRQKIANTPEAKGVYMEEGNAVAEPKPIAANPVSEKTINPEIIGIHWKVQEINGKTVKSNDDKEFFMELQAENNFKAYVGCNKLNGHYEYRDNRIHFMRVVGTMKECPNMDTEEDFKEVLESVDNFIIIDKSMQFRKGENVLAKFLATPNPNTHS